MAGTVLLEEMSWPEAQAALDAGVRTVVIVVASIEQHGPHLPTMTDTAIGRAVGERVARTLGRALLAPVIRPGCSDRLRAVLVARRQLRRARGGGTPWPDLGREIRACDAFGAVSVGG